MRTMMIVGGVLVVLLGVARVDAQIVDAQTQIYLKDLTGSVQGVAGSAVPPVAVLEGPRAVPPAVVLEGPGPEIGATVRRLRPDDPAVQGHGVVVESVAKDGPAFRVGLRPGDIILFSVFSAPSVDVDATREFARRVRETPPGGVLPLVVVRDGVRLMVSVVPEPARAQPPKQP
jgi:hypothetical protein